MDDRRFDTLTKQLAAGMNRRRALKGLLGLGGVAAVGGLLRDPSPAEAQRRPTPTPNVPTCSGDQVPCGNSCCCPDGSSACGSDCCPSGQAICCNNACCYGGCFAPGICCPPGQKGCNGSCIPESACCADSDCPNGSCIGGSCVPYTPTLEPTQTQPPPPTQTSVPPTNTTIPTQTPSSTPITPSATSTNTPVSSSTPTKTNTPTRTPTKTPVPSTATPSPTPAQSRMSGEVTQSPSGGCLIRGTLEGFAPNHTYRLIIVQIQLEGSGIPYITSEDVTTDAAGRGATQQFSPRFGGRLQDIDFLVDGTRRLVIGFQSRPSAPCQVLWENQYPER